MFTLRPLDAASDDEIRSVVAFSMMTVWETIPELRVDLHTVHGFSFDEMERTIRAGLKQTDHRYLLAVDGRDRLVGHTAFSVKKDKDGVLYGDCISRYVLPIHRRQGVASKFLEESLAWFTSMGATYAVALTHVENDALWRLFERAGFKRTDRLEGKWPTWVLRKDL